MPDRLTDGTLDFAGFVLWLVASGLSSWRAMFCGGAALPFLVAVVRFLTAHSGQAHFSPGLGIEKHPGGA